ncbi:hypothetical protein EHO59_14380 [Leptospira semungkisensis]|uniref:Uncharacterized protein n=1 Tax=Leptospira semungkisensis TaxID=2484985 RepID=A0A4R9FKM4_9LEPT|nr:hypothetical protein [Leptospira semungkisensis]TGJ99067.1 hypothetical protein EHO59_14380 [Leptospira semungkisensis]
MLEIRNSSKAKLLFLTFLLFLLGGSFALSSQTSANRKDSPIGIIAYCPAQSVKEKPFDFERTLALWYKRFKAERIQEGGGAILLVSAPYLPKNSVEIERIKTALGAEIVFAGFHPEQAKAEKKQTNPSNSKKVKSSKKQTKKSKSKKSKTKTAPKTDQKESLSSVVLSSEIPNSKGQAQESQKTDSSTSEKAPTNTSTQAPSKVSNPKKADKEKSTSSKSSQKNKKKGSKRKASPLSKKASPIIPSGHIVTKEEAGLNFLFYSPALESLQSKEKTEAPWIADFKAQFKNASEFHTLHFLLAQDPTPNLKEREGILSAQISEWKKDLLEGIPSVVLLSSPQSLRFFNGEYSFGCGATADSLKINILQLFFRNGRLIRISEEVQDLNSKESNKSWILE